MIKKITLFSLLFLLQISFASVAAAETRSDYDFRNTFENFQGGVAEQSGELEEDAESFVLSDFQDDDPFNDNNGVSGITNVLFTFLDFFKLIVTPIAVLVIMVMGIRMVTAGKNNEEVLTQSKNFIEYALIGLMAIFVSESIVSVFFGSEGEIFRYGEEGAESFGRGTSTLFEGIYTLLQAIVGAVAVFYLIMAGLRYVGGSFSDEEVAKAKRQITWSVVGLFIIAVSELVVKDILFQNKGESLGVNTAKDLFAQVTNFIVGTMGTLAFAFMLYAGYLYVTSAGNEDQVSKAKKIILWAFVGLLMAGAAFALTTTLVELDAGR